MKKILLGIYILTSVTMMSCSGFLDVEPTNSGDADIAVQTPADARVIVNGIMRNMANGAYYGRNLPLYGDVKGGDFTIPSQGRGYDYLYVFNHSASANAYSGVWSQGYHIIAQINNLIQSINKLKEAGSTDNFDNFLGQALTARAMIYFDLVRLYGQPYSEDKTAWGVPVVTEVLDYSAQERRVTVEETYAQILADLSAAESLLPKTRSNGYINYYANKAALARVYLYMEDYDKSLAAAQEIIGTTVYSLYNNEDWISSWTKEFGSEAIFELGIYPSEGDMGNSSLGAYYRRRAHGSSAILGYFMASDYFLERLGEDTDDVRWGVMAYDEISNTRLGACYKYSGSTSLAGDKNASNSTAVNIKVIRLSEVYLIAAEAALLKPSPDKALASDYLNQIRKRAPNLAPATTATISLDMIVDERSKELLSEGHRFFDMMRWNKTIEFNDELGAVSTIHRPKSLDRSFYKTILPIAESEINANPGLKEQQNPEY